MSDFLWQNVGMSINIVEKSLTLWKWRRRKRSSLFSFLVNDCSEMLHVNLCIEKFHDFTHSKCFFVAAWSIYVLQLKWANSTQLNNLQNIVIVYNPFKVVKKKKKKVYLIHLCWNYINNFVGINRNWAGFPKSSAWDWMWRRNIEMKLCVFWEKLKKDKPKNVSY